MAEQAVISSLAAIPPEVQDFANEHGVSHYLPAVIDVARQAFASCPLLVSLGEDAEDETHQYVALDVEVGWMSAEELLVAQSIWSAGVSHVCPSQHAVYFVLGWR